MALISWWNLNNSFECWLQSVECTIVIVNPMKQNIFVVVCNIYDDVIVDCDNAVVIVAVIAIVVVAIVDDDSRDIAVGYTAFYGKSIFCFNTFFFRNCAISENRKF